MTNTTIESLPFECLRHRIGWKILRLRVRVHQLVAVAKRAPRHVQVAVIICAILVIGPWDIAIDWIPVIGQLFEITVITLTVLYCNRFDPATAQALKNIFH